MTGVIMEAARVYWEKVYDVISDAGIDTKMMRARHVEQVMGRKIDIADSIYLSRICQIDTASPNLILPKLARSQSD